MQTNAIEKDDLLPVWGLVVLETVCAGTGGLGVPHGGLRWFRSPYILGGNVTNLAPNKALKSIAWRQVDF